MGDPQNEWFIGENLLKRMILGNSHFRKPAYVPCSCCNCQTPPQTKVWRDNCREDEGLQSMGVGGVWRSISDQVTLAMPQKLESAQSPVATTTNHDAETRNPQERSLFPALECCPWIPDSQAGVGDVLVFIEVTMIRRTKIVRMKI